MTHLPPDTDFEASVVPTTDVQHDSEVTGQSGIDPSLVGDASNETHFHKLHGSTIWLPCCDAALKFIFPILIGVVFMPLGMIGFGVAILSAISVVSYVIHYLTFRFRLTDRELVIQSGVLQRTERRIPFERVQETEIHQGPIHRLVGVARLEVTTAGSDAKEASLDVVTKAYAERVKNCIEGSSQETEETKPSDQNEFEFRLTSRDLLWGGLTSKLVATIGAIVSVILYFQIFIGVGGKWWGNFEKKLEGKEIPVGSAESWLLSQTPDLGPLNFIADFYLAETLAKSLSLALLGLFGSVVAYVVRYHQFRLTRNGRLLQSSYGLFSLRHGSFSRDRIQAIQIEEGILRRWAGLAAIRVDSAGDRHEVDESKYRDVLVPVLKRQDASRLVREAMPGLKESEPLWRRVSPLAVRRGSMKGWLLTGLIMLQTYFVAGWYCLAWLPILPMVYYLNLQWYRHRGYWLEDQHFLARKGWINRATICLPIKNIQNVSVTQSYFDRRLSLATLSVDTAGQSNTGGGPVIRHMPIEEAKRLQSILVT